MVPSFVGFGCVGHPGPFNPEGTTAAEEPEGMGTEAESRRMRRHCSCIPLHPAPGISRLEVQAPADGTGSSADEP